MSSASSATPAASPDHRPAIALLALLGAGGLLGVSTNLAKVASGAGIEPLTFLIWSLGGGSAILTVFAALRGRTPKLTRSSVEYFFVAALLSVAGANLILYSAIQHVGVGFVALTYSLPPLFTYLGALMLRMEKFCPWRAAAVGLALAGTLVLVLGMWRAPDTSRFWILLALLGPVLLAAGNIYRTRRWPPGASAESLAPGMLIASALLLIMISLLLPGGSLFMPVQSPQAAAMIAVQSTLFAAQFLLLFVLQRVGGPVFLSLIGAVSAVVGVPMAMAMLREPAVPGLMPGAALITAGIVGMVFGTRACRSFAARYRSGSRRMSGKPMARDRRGLEPGSE